MKLEVESVTPFAFAKAMPLLSAAHAKCQAAPCQFPLYTYNLCMISFDWESAKARANDRKHGVTFEEAQSMLYNEFARQYYESEGTRDEDRFLMQRKGNGSRALLVSHSEKSAGDVIRITSARNATRNEREPGLAWH